MLLRVLVKQKVGMKKGVDRLLGLLGGNVAISEGVVNLTKQPAVAAAFFHNHLIKRRNPRFEITPEGLAACLPNLRLEF